MASKRSLSDQLADIFSPKPREFDPESEDWKGGAAYRAMKSYESTDGLEEYDESKQSEKYQNAQVKRSMKAAPALGIAYSGKKSSRTSINRLWHDDEEKDKTINELSNGVSIQEMGSQDDNTNNETFEVNLDESSSSSEDADDMSYDFDQQTSKDPNMEEVTGLEEETEALERKMAEEDEMDRLNQEQQLKRLKSDHDEEMTRATEALNQKAIWDALLDIRLKLCQPQTDANRLPHHDSLGSFIELNSLLIKRRKLESSDDIDHLVDDGSIENDGKRELSISNSFHRNDSALASVNLKKKLEMTQMNIKLAINDLLGMQSLLEIQNPETSRGIELCENDMKLLPIERRKRLREDFDDSRSITSLGSEELWSKYLDNFNKPLISYSLSVLDKWSRKALYSSQLSSTKFKSLNQDVSVQVDQIFNSNREKMISRTQQMREDYHVLGKNDHHYQATRNVSDNMNIDAQKQSNSTKSFVDPELFDDGDFTQQLLKELMESGLQDSSDPVELTRRYLALRQQKRAQQMVKKLDRKASKGKTLKFTEQPKLVAFMAPVPGKYPMHDAYVTAQLLVSLFGNRPEYEGQKIDMKGYGENSSSEEDDV